ncbi:MAG: pyridoxal-phosphate dependent enzyme [Phycisphaerales bacterium]|nr:pyridoxal-phosphate dependent enzyme [Phycisphaerales bacterium]|tara:strand:- start:2866 stop:3825 length:960 start_codon:yes stop_codon:yes gene_type:complete
MSHAVCFEDVREAHDRIKEQVHRTPVLTSRTLDRMSGRSLFFKCENMQRVGAFKFRGACNAVMKLDDEASARGVCTHSSGNHAQALALAARNRGIPAWIVMPTSAPDVKRRAVEGYGATVVPCEPNLEARESNCARIVEETGANLIHPYDDRNVIAGQGTAAMELVEEVGPLDALVVPVGGGGLMSGSCLTMAAMCPDAAIIGAEPAGADDAARSLAAGELIPQTGPDTICDGLLTSLGQMNWPILRDHLSGIITVDDDQVVAAMRLIWERMKIIIEPSCATVLAVVLSEAFADVRAERVGLILTGGNVDLARLPFASR